VAFVPKLNAQDSVLAVGSYQESIDAHASSILFNEYSMLGGEQVIYSFQDRQDRALHKVVLSPLRLFGSTERSIDLRVNIAQQGVFSTFGIGLQKDVRGSLKSGRRTYAHLGGNVRLFPDWGSPERDVDGDGLADNKYSVSVFDVHAGIAHSVGGKLSFHATGHYQGIREQSTEGTPEVTAAGYSLSLVKDGQKLGPEALSTLNIRYGLSVEQLFAIENGGALALGQKYSLAYGPFMGIRMERYVDLRVSLPVLNREGRQDERGFGPFFVLSIWM